MLRLGPGEYLGRTVGRQSIGPLKVTTTCYGPGDILPKHCHDQSYLFVMLAGALKETALEPVMHFES